MQLTGDISTDLLALNNNPSYYVIDKTLSKDERRELIDKILKGNMDNSNEQTQDNR